MRCLRAPEFVLRTGDLSQLSKEDEFDTLEQCLKSVRADRIFYVPGERDILDDNGAKYRERYAKETKGGGLEQLRLQGRAFHRPGKCHEPEGGLGSLGQAQLDWIKRDVRPLKRSVPIVVFAHIPLWSVYPQWVWGTDDGAQALSYLRSFGSVAVQNGHIHQVVRKVEGNVTFHAAMSTAFLQPVPGQASSTLQGGQ